jgi:hypothetical protein
MPLNRREIALLAFVLLLAVVACFAPALAQPPQPHEFADQRMLWGVPHALDVLSNLPFALLGIIGLVTLHRARSVLTSGERACALLFLAGLLCATAGSAWYHHAPDDVGLAIDRCGMSVAFAGLLGLLAGSLVSERAGAAVAALLMVLAPAGVLAWFTTGNVLPWAVVQFGGMPLLLLAAVRRPAAHALQVRWALVLLAYALAKWCETNDHAIFAATGELLSGHTMKHLLAAFAAWPVIAAVAARLPRENAGGPASGPRLVKRFGRA